MNSFYTRYQEVQGSASRKAIVTYYLYIQPRKSDQDYLHRKLVQIARALHENNPLAESLLRGLLRFLPPQTSYAAYEPSSMARRIFQHLRLFAVTLNAHSILDHLENWYLAVLLVDHIMEEAFDLDAIAIPNHAQDPLLHTLTDFAMAAIGLVQSVIMADKDMRQIHTLCHQALDRIGQFIKQ